MPERVYNASNCGDNCARWILAIGKAQDITIDLYHLMNFGNRRFTIHVANTSETVHTMDELVFGCRQVPKGGRAMKGSYQVIARNNKVQIKLTISRNLTVLQGNSATGKTTLIELIAAYDELGEDSGAFVNCAAPCKGPGRT